MPDENDKEEDDNVDNCEYDQVRSVQLLMYMKTTTFKKKKIILFSHRKLII